MTARMVECTVEGRTGEVGTDGGRGRKCVDISVCDFGCFSRPRGRGWRCGVLWYSVEMVAPRECRIRKDARDESLPFDAKAKVKVKALPYPPAATISLLFARLLTVDSTAQKT